MKSVQKTVALTTLSLLLGGASPLCPSQAVTERSPQSTPHPTVIQVRAKSTDAPNSSPYRASISSTVFPADLETARKISALKSDSDHGDYAASFALCEHYGAIDNGEADRAHYYKLACQQYVDSAPESELKKQEQLAKNDGDTAFALAEGYTHAVKRKDTDKAAYFYPLAAKLGNADAQWHVANEYLSAEQPSQPRIFTALNYLKECANEYPEANVKIAYMYKKGIGVTSSKESAKKYMADAEQQIGLEATVKEFEQLEEAEAAKQLKKEQAAAPQELKQLEQEKLKCRENSIKCPNKQCLFQGHEWFFRYRPFYSCPKQITSGQPVYWCKNCHQAFHMDCIAHWRKRWNIKRKNECPNPKCCKPELETLSQEEQKKQKESLLAGIAS